MRSIRSNTNKHSSKGGCSSFTVVMLFFFVVWLLAVVKVVILQDTPLTPATFVENTGNNKNTQDISSTSAVVDTKSTIDAVKPPPANAPILLTRTAPKSPPATSILSWPPVQLDGTVNPQDGSDIMPITKLAVPKFWTPPDDQPITSIGSKVNGHETIFLMIASYRDFQCRETIASAFERADYPERLFVGAVDQIAEGDIGCTDTTVPCDEDPSQTLCKYRNQIAVYKMDATMATGPVTARHIGDRMYRGQYFVMQLDAHCMFIRHWDNLIINQWKQTGNEMAVLSSYLTDLQGSIDVHGDSKRNTRPIMCNSDFEGAMPARYLRHGAQPEDVPVIRDMPQLEPFWAAGFSFSRGHFKVQVPYDAYQSMVFQGEEISIGIRGFTYGYDFYAPRDSVVFHEYAERSQRRKTIHTFWENSPQHRGEGQKSLARSMSIVKMAPDIPDDAWDHSELDKYGIGDELFYKLFLIDPQQRKAVQLCPFVKSGTMHREFQPFLRKDGLGIDYSKLENFDTNQALENIFKTQRPAGINMINSAIKNNNIENLRWALENAKRIGIDRTSPDVYKKGEAALASMSKQ